MTIKKVIYFYGVTELANVHTVKLDEFERLNGRPSKHNWAGRNYRLAGYVGGIKRPVTRRIEYKANPSKHACDNRCMSAKGHVCECSCGGKNHGINA